MQKRSESAWAACLSEIKGESPTPKALAVTVVCGQNFPRMDKSGTCDPFIRFKPDDGQSVVKISKNGSLMTEERGSNVHIDRQNIETSVQKQTLFPTWDETFVIGFEDEENPGRLQLTAWDFDTITDDDFIGEIKIVCETLESWMSEDVGFVVLEVCLLRKGGLPVKGGETGTQNDASLHLKFEVIVDKKKFKDLEVSLPPRDLSESKRLTFRLSPGAG